MPDTPAPRRRDGSTSTWVSGLSGADGSATFFVDGLKHGSDYTVAFCNVSNAAGLQNLRFEVFDPLDSDDAFDPATQPGYSPAGYSTSNQRDGFSFAQDSGLARSATFAGGSIFAVADEMTHRGDILMFSGLNGAEQARVTFGLRDRLGKRGFLAFVRPPPGWRTRRPIPRPASMLLLSTGLVGNCRSLSPATASAPRLTAMGRGRAAVAAVAVSVVCLYAGTLFRRSPVTGRATTTSRTASS